MKPRWCVILIATSALSLAGCGAKATPRGDARGAERGPVSVRVAPVETRPVERTVEVVGSLRGWDDVTIGSKRTGRVIKVYRDIGDRVKPGEPIVELETVDADLAVDRAERSLKAELGKVGLHELPKTTFDESSVPSVAQARFAMEKARQNLSRERALRQRGAGTQQDFQNAEIDEQAAEAALANAVLAVRTILDNAMVAKVALDVAKQQRIDMEVRAPLPSQTPAGLKAPLVFAVSKRSASEGQMVREGDAVVSLVVENPLKLMVNVPERFSDDVKQGQEVRIVVAAFPGTTFVGKVMRINPTVDAVSRTFSVEAAVPNDESRLRPGGFAKASIVIRHDDSARTVPRESIVQAAGVTKLFVVEEGKARTIEVRTGLEGKGWVEVVGDVPPRALVVAEGQAQLADRTPVVIREVPPAPVKPAGAG